MSAFSVETTSTDSCPAKPTLSRTMSVVPQAELTPLERYASIPRPMLSRTMSVVPQAELTPLERSAFAKPPTLSRTMSMVHPEEEVVSAFRPVLSRTMSVVPPEDDEDVVSAFRPVLSRTMSVVPPEEENEFPVAPALRRTYAIGSELYDSPQNVPLPDPDESDTDPCEACMAIVARNGGLIEGVDTCGACRYGKCNWFEKSDKQEMSEEEEEEEEEEEGGSSPCLQ